MQLDYFTRKLKLAFPKATSLELDEMQLARPFLVTHLFHHCSQVDHLLCFLLSEKNLMDVSGVPASSRSDLSTFLKAGALLFSCIV